jgi:SAM-dependent MidA family methyltransferase
MSRPGPLAQRIRREIQAGGPIPFARFMDLALYTPDLGYYERAGRVLGRQGDFYTSVQVGSLFGELLAFEFARWAATRTQPGTRRPGAPSTAVGPADSPDRPATGRRPVPRAADAEVQGPGQVQFIEAGAHDGRLAADILGWLRRQRRELYNTLEYWIIEPSFRRRSWQQHTLADDGSRVRWAQSLAEVPAAGWRVLFCNELLDAMPLHRLGWDARRGEWFEWGVGHDGREFVWSRLMPQSAVQSSVPALLRDSQEALPDGYTIEVCSAAVAWWSEAARHLGTGKLVAFDYGLTEDELFVPERAGGTLRATHRHQHSADLLANPGEQDLTAHVNFSAVRQAGEDAGLTTDGLVTQEQFLTHLVARAWSNPASFDPWTPEQRRQFQTLTHPQHLGRAFRVLIQAA